MNLPPPLPANQLALPQWAYVPGEMDEADADHDTLWQAKVLVPSRFRDYVPARHPALRYGLALNDRGYFWEAQEILEAVWAAAPQGGREPGGGRLRRARLPHLAVCVVRAQRRGWVDLPGA